MKLLKSLVTGTDFQSDPINRKEITEDNESCITEDDADTFVDVVRHLSKDHPEYKQRIEALKALRRRDPAGFLKIINWN